MIYISKISSKVLFVLCKAVLQAIGHLRVKLEINANNERNTIKSRANASIETFIRSKNTARNEE